MSPILTALKALYVALGGKLTDYYADIAGGIPVSQMVLTADLVACLSKLSIGIELPAVTAADNGDVLTVVSGKWAKAAAAGGKTLYNHSLLVVWTDDNLGPMNAVCSIVSDSSEQMTVSALAHYLADTGAKIVANGYSMSSGSDAPAYFFAGVGSTVGLQLTNPPYQLTVPATASVTDKVVEL